MVRFVLIRYRRRGLAGSAQKRVVIGRAIRQVQQFRIFVRDETAQQESEGQRK
jgi:hypothetical protein